MRCFVMMTLNVSLSFTKTKTKKKDERYAFCFVEGWDMSFTSREHFYNGATNIFDFFFVEYSLSKETIGEYKL